MRVKPVNPRAKKNCAVFPGYLFVRADIKQTGAVCFSMDAACKRAGGLWRGTFDRIENLIQTLQTKLELLNTEENEKQKSPYKPGDLLRIDQGPFKGMRQSSMSKFQAKIGCECY
jgi:transcription antitermination factor NusG